MNQTATTTDVPEFRIAGISYGMVLRVSLWLMFASSFAVRVDPAPTDAVFAMCLFLSLFGGLAFSTATLTIIALLILYNLGGIVSLIGYTNDFEAVKFILISIMMLCIFMLVLGSIVRKPEETIATINSGWIAGAVIASLLGIMGAIGVAGTYDIFSDQGRAVALFKDPNVYATFLIYPAAVLFQGLLIGERGNIILRTIAFVVILMALFLAFSRGAWINFAFTTVLIAGMTFMFAGQGLLRFRIIIITVLGVAIGMVLIAALLSNQLVREMFMDRFSLQKSYDVGETGRFGNQLNAIPELLQLPLGYGPLQFWKRFGQDPHNTFLNAFASYGWLGGFTYIAIVLCSLAAGLKTVFADTKYRRIAIVVFATLTALFFQGVQIDTEHWRHMFWLLGLQWGLYAVVQSEILQRQNEE